MTQKIIKETVLILDFGSQYTKLIARRVRELGVFSQVLSYRVSLSEIEKCASLGAVILSGGPQSVGKSDAFSLPSGFWEFQERQNIPVLGICYGLQKIVKDFGGKIRSDVSKREYGVSKIFVEEEGFFPKKVFSAWMSHGDSIEFLSKEFRVLAKSEQGVVAGVSFPKRRIYGLQFHPEVTHTEWGKEILASFLTKVAHLQPSWNVKTFLKDEIELLKEKVSKQAHLLCALSGGVDSTVCAVLAQKAFPGRVHAVLVDNGFLRKDEAKELSFFFKKELKLPVTILSEGERFFSSLKGVIDPEKKRKIIGKLFIDIFSTFKKKLEQEKKISIPFFIQGTLYPDVIESGGISQGTIAQTIKSHHNVGGLPKKMGFQLIEPLRELFKDEVRALGAELKIPEYFLKRHPFPGPGLSVRILGEVTEEKVHILQRVDAIWMEELKQAGFYDRIWQAFSVLLPVKTVGVQGDQRTHARVVALRAVCSQDGMTASVFSFPVEFLVQVSTRICNQVSEVNRVVYDCTTKPPGTIEWE